MKLKTFLFLFVFLICSFLVNAQDFRTSSDYFLEEEKLLLNGTWANKVTDNDLALVLKVFIKKDFSEIHYALVNYNLDQLSFFYLKKSICDEFSCNVKFNDEKSTIVFDLPNIESYYRIKQTIKEYLKN